MPVIQNFIREECVRKKTISEALSDDHIRNLEPLNKAFVEAFGIKLRVTDNDFPV